MSLILHTASVSDPGLVRPNNEDAVYVGRRLIAVADGIGGQPAGEVASGLVIQALAPLDQSAPDGEPMAALSRAILAANQHIRDAAAADPASDGMGSTVTAMLLCGDDLAMVHVGDSRGYLLRQGALHQLTRDDTFVQMLVDDGVLTAEQARVHPQRSLVTSAVQGLDVEPSTGVLPGAAGDRLLLCSDGLSDVVTDQAIAQALATYAEPQQCAEQLVKLAHQAGAPDNVTVVVADLVAA
jgi:PPM family protein phosphatase